MTIKHLRIFVAVVDNKTMHAAAEKLFISQPTITQTIKEMEEHYGCLLFERFGKRLVITPVGRELLGYARGLLAEYERMEQAIVSLGNLELIRVGATISIGEQMLVPLITEFETMHPKVRLDVVVDNSENLLGRLASGRLDVCVLDGTDRGDEMVLLPFHRDRLTLVAAPGHPLSEEAFITPEQLAQYDFVMREEGSVPRRLLTAYFGRYGITPRIKWSCANLHTVIQAVAAGQGISLLYSVLVQKEIDAGVLVEIPVPELSGERDIALAIHRHKARSQALEHFIEHCRQFGQFRE